MADIDMTINADKTIGLSTHSLGSQGERVSVDVVVPAAVAALGYEAYIDFLLPDGSSCYKGGYDCSSEAFSFALGETDSVMDKDGEVQIQFWVGTIVAAVKTVHWITSIKKTKVNKSIGATSAAILPYLPQMVIPASYPAANISVEDAGGNWANNNVEGVLSEVLLKCWPIGSIYVGVGSTSPDTLFGGTWSVFGAGKVMVGIDSSDADFDAVEETRGAKTVTLDATMIPAHTHYTTINDAGAHSADHILTGGADANLRTITTSSIGGGLAHNNIQPSIVVRMWKRTA